MDDTVLFENSISLIWFSVRNADVTHNTQSIVHFHFVGGCCCIHRTITTITSMFPRSMTMSAFGGQLRQLRRVKPVPSIQQSRLSSVSGARSQSARCFSSTQPWQATTIAPQTAEAQHSTLPPLVTKHKASRTPRPTTPEATATKEDAPSAVPKKKKRKRVLKNPIVVTDRALRRIEELLAQADGAIGLRLGVRRRGCNGLSYTLNYAYPESHAKFELKAMKGATVMTVGEADQAISVYIEPMALFNVVGTTMDFVETELSSEFTFENPNSKGECGCGESFNV
jgi:iron-sulfur cluster assembly 1